MKDRLDEYRVRRAVDFRRLFAGVLVARGNDFMQAQAFALRLRPLAAPKAEEGCSDMEGLACSLDV